MQINGQVRKTSLQFLKCNVFLTSNSSLICLQNISVFNTTICNETSPEEKACGLKLHYCAGMMSSDFMDELMA